MSGDMVCEYMPCTLFMYYLLCRQQAPLQVSYVATVAATVQITCAHCAVERRGKRKLYYQVISVITASAFTSHVYSSRTVYRLITIVYSAIVKEESFQL